MAVRPSRRPLPAAVAAVAAVLLATAAALPARAQLVPVGEPIPIAHPGPVFLGADGRFAVVWREVGEDEPYSLWMQPWSWQGEPLSPPLRLDAERPMAGFDFETGAAPDGSGDFVVAWDDGSPRRFPFRRATVDGALAPVETLLLPEDAWGVPAVALGPGGRLSWAWRRLAGGVGEEDLYLRIRVWPFGGSILEVGGDVYVRELRLTSSPDGVLWLSWEHGSDPPPAPQTSNFVAFGFGWSRWIHSFRMLPLSHQTRPKVALDGPRALLVIDSGLAYDDGADGHCTGVFAQPAPVDGERVATFVHLVNPRPTGCQHNLAAQGSSTGGFLVVWGSILYHPGDPADDGLWLRTYGSDGMPLGDPLRVSNDHGVGGADYESGRAVVATRSGIRRFAAPPVACEPGAAHLCLGGGRFRVEVDQRNPYPPYGQGIGRAVPLTADSGAFWFFHPDNLELMTKVLDGRPVNDRWWVFSAALTTVERWTMVFDGSTGAQALYHDPPYQLGGRADTAAFADGGVLLAGGAVLDGAAFLAEAAEPDGPATASPAAAAGDCRTGPEVAPEIPACDDPHVLCLQDGRFALSVGWRDPRSGDTGVGRPRPITGDTGAFWFFHPHNLELMAKVLDARPLDGHWWVFSGSLSDVEHTLEVVDRASGLQRCYANPPYTLGSHADTAAFTDDP